VTGEPKIVPLAALIGKARSGGLSIAAFARQTGVGRTTIQNAIHGRYRLGPDSAERIANATGTLAVQVEGKFMFMDKEK
jgi:transcriptional regulator with XRE-family HTH domain